MFKVAVIKFGCGVEGCYSRHYRHAVNGEGIKTCLSGGYRCEEELGCRWRS